MSLEKRDLIQMSIEIKERSAKSNNKGRPSIDICIHTTIRSIISQFVRVRLKSEREGVEYSFTPMGVRTYCSQNNSSYGRNRTYRRSIGDPSLMIFRKRIKKSVHDRFDKFTSLNSNEH